MGTWSIIFGMKPATSVPVLSVRYLPTMPLALAIPCGKRDERELRRMRADSQALAASTTTRARTCLSLPSARSTYDTPVARPFASTVTSRAMAPVTSRSFPVCSAGSMSTPLLVKLALTVQPRLHCPQ